MLDKFVEELLIIDKQVDAMQIAEILWLSSEVIKPSIKTSTNTDNDTKVGKPCEIEPSTPNHLPRVVPHTIVIGKALETHEEPQHGFEKDNSKEGFYGSYFHYKEHLPNILKQFQSLRIKQPTLKPTELDESKTADYIATTHLYNPIFKSSKERNGAIHLNIIIDKSKSMFLWDGAIEHFEKSLRSSSLFGQIDSYFLDSNSDRVTIQESLTYRVIKVDSPRFKKSKTLTLVFSDVVGELWQDKTMFATLDDWSKHSLTVIVSMLPKRMWQKTPLRLGISQYLKNSKFLPKNSDLKSEYAFVENDLQKNQIKVPVIPYDEDAFKYIANIVTAKKDSWIESRIFTVDEKAKTKSSPISEVESTPQERVKKYLAFAAKEARALAIYASVLPLHKKILEELITLKSLGRGMDAFAEFYFGGLLDREASSQDNTLYRFYHGVRRELINHITIEETKSIYAMLDRIIKESLGVNQGLLSLLYEQSDTTEKLSSNEKELVKLLIEVLGSKGEYFRSTITSLSGTLQTIHPPKNHFQMGSDDGVDDEKPVHKVTFDYSFEIAKHPVTFEEYDLYCEDTKRDKPKDQGWGRGRRPVINVSWDDAQSYCDWLNDKLGIKSDKYNYRLPTEAEWEYACRAGTTTKWSFGDDESKLKEYAWYDDKDRNKTEPVGKLRANPWGLHDMHGNVWEWCQDDWIDSYEKTPRDGTAYEDKSSSSKVLRGGSWNYLADGARSACRFDWNPSDRIDVGGFRLLRTLP